MGDSASTVSQALTEVEQWRKTAEQASKREMVALARESDSLRVTVQNLMQQLEARKIREESDKFGKQVEDFRTMFQKTAPVTVAASTIKVDDVRPAYDILDHFHHGEKDLAQRRPPLRTARLRVRDPGSERTVVIVRHLQVHARDAVAAVLEHSGVLDDVGVLEPLHCAFLLEVEFGVGVAQGETL